MAAGIIILKIGIPKDPEVTVSLKKVKPPRGKPWGFLAKESKIHALMPLKIDGREEEKRGYGQSLNPLIFMVGTGRFELPTSTVSG